MNYVSGHWTRPAALSWLETVLAERFGHVFLLTRTESGLTLRLAGSDGGIQFDQINNSFTQSSSSIPLANWDGDGEHGTFVLGWSIPAPGVSTLPIPLIEQVPSGFRIHYDILGLTYWMLTRQEEIGRNDLDHHNRFPATASHAFKHGYLDRPIVDEWLEILGQVIQRTWPGIELKQHRFSMKVSHDVDGPSLYAFRSWAGIARSMAGDLFKRRDPGRALRAPWIRLDSSERLHPADPANTFDWIMDVSERHGLASAFYFICGRTDANKDADYEPEHPAIRDLMRRIHRRGHEIGLHPSYDTYRQPAAIAAEARRLRTIVEQEGIRQTKWGGRMHFLRWEHPTTLRAWDAAGMDYDSTLSYADLPGFRCGTCFEYPAFDPVAQQMLKLRIRPLVAMECTVMAPRYMGLGTGEAAFAKFKQLKDTCRAVEGSYTLLWHNTQLEKADERQLYEDVIKN